MIANRTVSYLIFLVVALVLHAWVTPVPAQQLATTPGFEKALKRAQTERKPILLVVKLLSTELTQRTRSLIEEVAARKSKDPVFVNRVLKRGVAWQQTVTGLTRMTRSTLSVVEMNQMVKQIDTNLGNQAKLAEKVRLRSKKAVDGFLQTRAELEGVLTSK
jgi:hypothetical protein